MEARRPSHAEQCRTLAAIARTASLATIARDPAGYPYASLVAIAVDGRGCPILCLSTLAEHTENLDARPAASILLSEPAGTDDDRLALGRVTLMGDCRRIAAGDASEARAAFLAAHPGAARYIDFKDFAFHRLEPSALRYVGGFGRMSWVKAVDYHAAEPDPLAPHATGILDHMNDEHADAVLAYAHALAGHADATSARMTAVDRYGFDLSVTTPAGTPPARVAFEAEATTADAVRVAMIALLRRARSTAAT